MANRVSPVELPTDNYFANVQDLFGKLDGIGELLEDPRITSVRLVTNPEKMVLRETQRAFVYFSLHGLTVDGVIVNRVLPERSRPTRSSAEWRISQSRILERDRRLLRARAREACAAVHATRCWGASASRSWPRAVRR